MDNLCSGKMDAPGHFLPLPCSDDDALVMPTYDDSHTISSPRTYLSIHSTYFTAVYSIIVSCVNISRAFIYTRRRLPKSLLVARQYKRVDHCLCAYSHLTATDLETILDRARILRTNLPHYRRDLSRHRRRSQSNGRPNRSRKASLWHVLDTLK